MFAAVMFIITRQAGSVRRLLNILIWSDMSAGQLLRRSAAKLRGLKSVMRL